MRFLDFFDHYSKTGMFLRAVKEHDMDLAGSYMMGDKFTDVEVGRAVGCVPFLILTGYGREDVRRYPIDPIRSVADLSVTTDLILANPLRSSVMGLKIPLYDLTHIT